jgi:hypothetical protein
VRRRCQPRRDVSQGHKSHQRVEPPDGRRAAPRTDHLTQPDFSDGAPPRSGSIFTQQLRHAIHRLRRGRVLLDIRLVLGAVEDEVRAVVDERGTALPCCTRERPHGLSVHEASLLGREFGPVHAVERRTVEDERWAHVPHERRHIGFARDVERVHVRAHDATRCQYLREKRGPELT